MKFRGSALGSSYSPDPSFLSPFSPCLLGRVWEPNQAGSWFIKGLGTDIWRSSHLDCSRVGAAGSLYANQKGVPRTGSIESGFDLACGDVIKFSQPHPPPRVASQTLSPNVFPVIQLSCTIITIILISVLHHVTTVQSLTSGSLIYKKHISICCDNKSLKK